jgi:hypothetical protein
MDAPMFLYGPRFLDAPNVFICAKVFGCANVFVCAKVFRWANVFVCAKVLDAAMFLYIFAHAYILCILPAFLFSMRQ